MWPSRSSWRIRPGRGRRRRGRDVVGGDKDLVGGGDCGLGVALAMSAAALNAVVGRRKVGALVGTRPPSHSGPLRVRPDRRLPPTRGWPGDRPDHEGQVTGAGLGSGSCLAISASSISAARGSTPEIVSSSSISRWQRAVSSSMRSDSRRQRLVEESICPSIWLTSTTWRPMNRPCSASHGLAACGAQVPLAGRRAGRVVGAGDKRSSIARPESRAPARPPRAAKCWRPEHLVEAPHPARAG